MMTVWYKLCLKFVLTFLLPLCPSLNFVLAPYTIISLTLADKLTKAVTGKDAL